MVVHEVPRESAVCMSHALVGLACGVSAQETALMELVNEPKGPVPGDAELVGGITKGCIASHQDARFVFRQCQREKIETARFGKSRRPLLGLFDEFSGD